MNSGLFLSNAGKILFVAGALMMLAGLVLWLGGSRFGWLGNLPGDIRIEKENFRFYFPVTTMILFSIFVTLMIWLIRKFFS